MSDPDQTIAWSNGTSHDLQDQVWGYDDAAVEQQSVEDLAGTYTSLGYIGAALRRTAWFWCLIAVTGLLIGAAVYVKFPPSYQATTTLVLTEEANEDPGTAIQTDAVLAQSVGVATQVVHQLGLQQSPGSLIAATNVTAVTDQVLVITVSAPTSEDAVRRTSTLASAFLQIRTDYLGSQQQFLKIQVDQQVSQAQRRLASLSDEIDKVSAEVSSSAQRASLSKLEAQSNAQNGIVQNELGTLAAAQTSLTTVVHGSKVLNPASAIPRSHYKRAALYLGGGLLTGLAAGIVIVIIWALTTDRLRRRDEIAYAVGAPVRLSVGRLRRPRWSLGRFGRARRARDADRVVAHLRSRIPADAEGTASLAIVAVDNLRAVVPVVRSLALTCAREGMRVLVADLAGGTLASQLGSSTPGARLVAVDRAHLVVAVPEPGDVTPAGPRGTRPSYPPVSETLLAACADADVLLTITTLDPALGSDHLATWASDAITMVTAGKSSVSRIHAVGEMVRLAGMHLVSVVLLGADKRDGSIVAARVPDQAASALGCLGPLVHWMRWRIGSDAEGYRSGLFVGWRRLVIVAVVMIMAFSVATLRVILRPAQGMPASVSAIVMLAGPGDRLSAALRLATEHRAPMLVVSRGWQGYSGPCPPGTPGVKTICFDPDPGNTRGEAEFIGQLAKRYGWHSIVLVTTPEQDTRARMQVGRCFGGSIYAITTALPAGELPYQVAYGWGALFKALVLYRTC